MRIIRIREVREKTGQPTSTIYDRMAEGTFPRPVPLGPKAVGWIEAEIDEWISARIAARDTQSERDSRRKSAGA